MKKLLGAVLLIIGILGVLYFLGIFSAPITQGQIINAKDGILCPDGFVCYVTPFINCNSVKLTETYNEYYECSNNVYIGDRVVDTILYNSIEPSGTKDMLYKYTFTVPTANIFKYDGFVNLVEKPITEDTCLTIFGNINPGDMLCDDNYMMSCIKPIFGDSEVVGTNCRVLNQACSVKYEKCYAYYTLTVDIPTTVIKDSDFSIGINLKEDIPVDRKIQAVLYNTNKVFDSDLSIGSDSNRELILTAPTTPGTYNVNVIMNHPQVTYNKIFEVSIIEPIDVSVISKSVQSPDDDIIVTINTEFENKFISAQDIDLNAKFNNYQVSATKLTQTAIGIYEAKYKLSGIGNLTISARARNFGVWSSWTPEKIISIELD